MHTARANSASIPEASPAATRYDVCRTVTSSEDFFFVRDRFLNYTVVGTFRSRKDAEIRCAFLWLEHLLELKQNQLDV